MQMKKVMNGKRKLRKKRMERKKSERRQERKNGKKGVIKRRKEKR